MAVVSTWSGVQVSMQSALAAAKTLTAITKASPAVATSTAHGYTNGQEVKLSVSGMVQLDGRVVRVANVTANTFEIEGVDSTLFDTFTAGTAELVTFGTSFNVFTSVQGSGGDFDFIDTTTIHATAKSQVPGAANAATFNFDALWDPADTGLAAAKSASDSKAQRCFKIAWPNGRKALFVGYVGASLIPGGSAQDKVTTQVTITAFGALTAYSS
jgi:hypothetical protein